MQTEAMVQRRSHCLATATVLASMLAFGGCTLLAREQGSD